MQKSIDIIKPYHYNEYIEDEYLSSFCSFFLFSILNKTDIQNMLDNNNLEFFVNEVSEFSDFNLPKKYIPDVFEVLIVKILNSKLSYEKKKKNLNKIFNLSVFSHLKNYKIDMLPFLSSYNLNKNDIEIRNKILSRNILQKLLKKDYFVNLPNKNNNDIVSNIYNFPEFKTLMDNEEKNVNLQNEKEFLEFIESHFVLPYELGKVIEKYKINEKNLNTSEDELKEKDSCFLSLKKEIILIKNETDNNQVLTKDQDEILKKCIEFFFKNIINPSKTQKEQYDKIMSDNQNDYYNGITSRYNFIPGLYTLICIYENKKEEAQKLFNEILNMNNCSIGKAFVLLNNESSIYHENKIIELIATEICKSVSGFSILYTNIYEKDTLINKKNSNILDNKNIDIHINIHKFLDQIVDNCCEKIFKKDEATGMTFFNGDFTDYSEKAYEIILKRPMENLDEKDYHINPEEQKKIILFFLYDIFEEDKKFSKIIEKKYDIISIEIEYKKTKMKEINKTKEIQKT